MACLIRRLYVLMTMLFFTRPRLISTQITAQATANLRPHLNSTEHPTTILHQAYTALLSDSTVSKAQDTEESATAQPLQVVHHRQYQPAILAAVTNDPTSNTTEVTHNQFSSPGTLNVASQNSSIGNQQQITMQSRKSSSEQPAHMISQTSFSGYTSSAATQVNLDLKQKQTALAPSDSPNVQSTIEADQETSILKTTESSSEQKTKAGRDAYLAITTASTTLTPVHKTNEQQTTTAQPPQIQVQLSQILSPAVILRAPDPTTIVASVLSSLEEKKAIPSSTTEVQVSSMPNVYSTTLYQPTNLVYHNSYSEKSLASIFGSSTPSSSTSENDQANVTLEKLSLALISPNSSSEQSITQAPDLTIITTISTTFTQVHRTNEQQTTTAPPPQIQVQLSQIFSPTVILRAPDPKTIVASVLSSLEEQKVIPTITAEVQVSSVPNVYSTTLYQPTNLVYHNSYSEKSLTSIFGSSTPSSSTSENDQANVSLEKLSLALISPNSSSEQSITQSPDLTIITTISTTFTQVHRTNEQQTTTAPPPQIQVQLSQIFSPTVILRAPDPTTIVASVLSSLEEQKVIPTITAEVQVSSVPNVYSTTLYQPTNLVYHNSYSEKSLTSIFGSSTPSSSTSENDQANVSLEKLSLALISPNSSSEQSITRASDLTIITATSTTFTQVHRTNEQQTTTAPPPQIQVQLSQILSPTVILRAPDPTTIFAFVLSSLEEQKAIPSITAKVQVSSVPNVYSTTLHQPTNLVYHNSYTEKSSASALRSLTPSSSTSAGDKGNSLAVIITTTSTTLKPIYRTNEQQATTEALTPIQAGLSQTFWPQIIHRVPDASTTVAPIASAIAQPTTPLQQNSTTENQITSISYLNSALKSLPLYHQNSSTEQSSIYESQLNPSSQIASLIAPNSSSGEALLSVDQVNLTQEQQNTSSSVQPITSTPYESPSNQISSLILQNTFIGQKTTSLDQPATSLSHQNTISPAKSSGQSITLTSFKGFPSELQTSMSQNSYPSRPLLSVVQLTSTLEQKISISLAQNSTPYNQSITGTPLLGSSAKFPSLTLQNNSVSQPSSAVDQMFSVQDKHNNTSLSQSNYFGKPATVKSYETAPAKVQSTVSSNISSVQSTLPVDKLTFSSQIHNVTFLAQNDSNGRPITASSHTGSSAQLSQNSIFEQKETDGPSMSSAPKLQALPSLSQNGPSEELATTSARLYSTTKFTFLIPKYNYTEQLLSITHQSETAYKQQPTTLIYHGKPTTDLPDADSKVQNATLIPYNSNTGQISPSASQQHPSLELSSLNLQSNSTEQPSSPVDQTKSAVKLFSEDSPFGLKPTSTESQPSFFVQPTTFIPQNSSILTDQLPSALPQANLTAEQRFTKILGLQNKNSSGLFATPVPIVNSTIQQNLTVLSENKLTKAPTSTIEDEVTPNPFTFLPTISSSQQKFKTIEFDVHSSLHEKNSTSFTARETAASSKFYSPQQSTAITLPPLGKVTTLRFIFLLEKVDFDFDLFNNITTTYKRIQESVTSEILSHLGPRGVSSVKILYMRPGSVEVTAVLTLNDEYSTSKVYEEINKLNKTGKLGNITWTALYWGVEDKSCTPPEVSITNLPERGGRQSALSILRSKNFIIQATVGKVECSSSQALQFAWYLFKFEIKASGNIEIQKKILLGSRITEWTLQKRTLDYGQYYVDFRAAYSNQPSVTSSILGFFKISKSKLIADIVGGNKVTRGKGEPILLDGSASRDPDVERGDHTSMHFTWLCKKRQEHFPNVSLALLPLINSSLGPGHGGCFGTGVGKLNSNGTVVSLETSLMTVGELYDVKLIVTKDDRADDFTQEIKIVSGNPPQVTMRCLINCEKTASASTRISIATTCKGLACQTATYHWELVIVDSTGSELQGNILTRNMTETDMDLPGIIIKANQLQRLNVSERFYRLKVLVSQDDGPDGNAAYQFRVNAPPSPGICNVTPTNGQALKTAFTFLCTDWQDPHQPLTYQFHYKTDRGLYTVVQYGSTDQVTTVLPSGKGKNGNIIEFEIMITDSLSASSNFVLHVKVEPPPANDSLSELAVGNSSQFNILVQSGNVRGATQLANAVLGTVEESNSTSTEDKIEIKNSIMKTVSSIQVSNLQSLTQVTSVIARATLEPSEVTPDTQDLALQALKSMTSLLRSKTNEDYSSESVLVEQGGENLVLSLGNILNSASQKASVIDRKAETSETQSKSENVSKDTAKLIDDVSVALLSKMLVDQEPNRVQTQSLSMVLNRLSPRSLKTATNFTDDPYAGEFKFTFNAITDEKARDAEYIDSVMTLSTFNPFTWDVSAARVDSHVLSLTIKNHEGQTLSVKDSDEYIEMKIPREGNFPPEESGLYFVKPSSGGKMQYHVVSLPHADGSAVRFRIKPTADNAIFKVFVRHGQRPTVTEHDISKQIPHPSCLKASQDSYSHCSNEAYDILLLPDELNKPGQYYIGIQYEKDEGELQSRRKKRSCSGRGRQKRSCVEVKEPLRPENITVKPVYDPKTDVNYSMNLLEESCLFWDSIEERWLSRGCKVGPGSDVSLLHCLCDHLTSFGGGVLVMPNKLDFDVVFYELTRLHETGNVAVLVTLIAALLLYFLVVVFARKNDKQDKAKSGPVFHLLSSDEANDFKYQLTLATGVWKNSGTDARIVIVIHGSEAQSEPLILQKNMLDSRTLLARGNEDTFGIHLPMSLGELEYLRIWHDNSGKDPSWFLIHAKVVDRQMGKKWTFFCNDWFALEKGDGKIDRILTPVCSQEMQTFSYALRSQGSKGFSDEHVWLSVITRPPRSRFTRVQRATCCLCILLSAMLTNALFYRTDKEPDPTLQIGPLKFSGRQIMVGIESALIVTPLNLMIMTFFKRSAKKTPNKVDVEKPKNSPAPFCGKLSTTSSGDINGVDDALNEKRSYLDKNSQSQTDVKKKFTLPHFFTYIAWFLVFVTVSVSSIFTFFFSLQWGKDISNQWLSSMFISFTQDFIVLQPVKVLIIIVLTAYLFRNNDDNETVSQNTEEKPHSETKRVENNQSVQVEMPKEDELIRAKEYRIKETEMFSFLRELLGHLLFFVLLIIVCYGSRSYHGYLMTMDLKNTLGEFSLAEDPRYFWEWLDVQFVEGVYVSEWYNTDKTKQQEYVGNKMSILLGMPRLRQLRIQKDSCVVPRIVRGIINRDCYDFYNFNEEDKNPVNLPGWRPFSGSVKWANFSDLCPAPWQYVPSKKLHDSTSWGYFDVYDGGGYIADLGYNRSTAQAVISNLIEYSWIDQQTRAVILEFTIYSPSTGYLIISAYHYEILPTGYGHPFPKLDTLQLTSAETGFYEFYLNCQFFFIMMAFVFLLKEIYKLYRTKWTYFREVWNWVEILQIINSVLVVVFYILKSNLILKQAAMVKKSPFAFVSFGDAVSWNHTETTVLAIAVFLATLKLLHIIRFNSHISIMMSSFRVSKSLLLSYSVIFVIILLSYAQMGRLAFGDHIQGYSSLLSTLFSAVTMCLGGQMSFHELMRVNRFLGPLYGISFLALMSFIFMNFFVAILNDSFEDVKSNIDKQSKEFEMADFLLKRVRELLGIDKRAQDSCQNDSTREDDTASTNSQDRSSLPLQRGQDAGQNDTMQEGETASTNAHDHSNLPLQKTLEGSNSKPDETLSTEAKQTLITKSPSEYLAAKLELKKSIGPKSWKRTLETLKEDSLCEFDLDSSLEHLFDRIGVLTNNLATEDKRQDVKLLYMISKLSLKRNYETSCQENLSTPHQIQESSSVTVTSQDNIEKKRSRRSKNSSEDEIMKFIRSRSTRELPIHLKVGSFYQQLQNDKTGGK